MVFAPLTFGLATLFSLVLPLCVVFMRDTVKRQRQGYIRILDKMFGPQGGTPPPKQESPAGGIVAGFEFVKFKYFMQQSAPDPEVADHPFDSDDRPTDENGRGCKNDSKKQKRGFHIFTRVTSAGGAAREAAKSRRVIFIFSLGCCPAYRSSSSCSCSHTSRHPPYCTR